MTHTHTHTHLCEQVLAEEDNEVLDSLGQDVGGHVAEINNLCAFALCKKEKKGEKKEIVSTKKKKMRM